MSSISDQHAVSCRVFVPGWVPGLLLALISAGACALQAGPFAMWVLALAPGLAIVPLVTGRFRLVEGVLLSPALSLLCWGGAAIVGLSALGSLPGPLWVPVFAGATAVAMGCRRVCVSWAARPHEAMGLLASALWAIPVSVLMQSTGPTVVEGLPAFRSIPWYGADTLYLAALAEMTVQRGGLTLENPFVAGAANRYPVLVPAAIGALSAVAGEPALYTLHRIAAPWCVSAVGLLFLVVGGVARHRQALLPAALGCVAVLVIRPDLLIYPQAQAFAFPLLLVCWWCVARPTARTRIAAMALAAGAILSHAITGGVALVLLAAYAVQEVMRHGRTRTGLAMSGGVTGLAIMYLWAHAGGRAGAVGVSMVGQGWGDVAKEVVPFTMAAVVCGVAAARGLARTRVLSAVILMLLIAGLGYAIRGLLQQDAFIRWFTLYNAPRFWWFALVLGAPMLARCARPWWVAGLVAIGLSALVLPPRQMGGTLRMFTEPPHLFGPDLLSAAAWLRESTPAETRVVTNLSVYAVPALTGRPELTSDYVNLWGVGTLSETEFAAMRADRGVIVDKQTNQSDRLSTARSRGIGVAVIYADESGGADAAAAASSLFPVVVVKAGFSAGRIGVLDLGGVERASGDGQ